MESIELLTLINKLNDIQTQLNSLKIHSPVDAYSSTETKELDTAFAKAQGEFESIGNNRDNPYFKSTYADLNTILKSARKALSKYGLSFVQQLRLNTDGMTILHSILKHSSGQWIESRVRVVPPKGDIQSYGSTITYLRRYSAMALLGITVDNDFSDDDGEIAMEDERKMIAKGTSINYNPRDQTYETITKEQLDMLEAELKKLPGEEPGRICEQILERQELHTLADMRKSSFHATITKVRELQQQRAGNPKYQ